MFSVFFKQKTAYEMRISDWSSDVCSSDLQDFHLLPPIRASSPGRRHASRNHWGSGEQIQSSGGQLHLAYNLLRSVAQIVSGHDGQARRCKNFLALFHIGAFQAHNQRDRQVYFLCRRDDAIRDDVAAHDAAKDIDEDRSEEHTSEPQSLTRNSYTVSCL